MTKAQLVAIMAKKAGITKKAAETALESTLKSIREARKGRNKVTLKGVGTFSVARRGARRGRIPMTGRSIRIPAARTSRAGRFLPIGGEKIVQRGARGKDPFLDSLLELSESY